MVQIWDPELLLGTGHRQALLKWSQLQGRCCPTAALAAAGSLWVSPEPEAAFSLGEGPRSSCEALLVKTFFGHQNAALTNRGFVVFCKITAGQDRGTCRSCRVMGVQPV